MAVDYANGTRNPPQWSIGAPLPSSGVYAQWAPPTPNRPCQVWSVTAGVSDLSTSLPYTGTAGVGPLIVLSIIGRGQIGQEVLPSGWIIDRDIPGQADFAVFRPYRPYYLAAGQALQLLVVDPTAALTITGSAHVEWVQPLQ